MKKIITPEVFEERLKKIVDKTYAEVVRLILDTRRSNLGTDDLGMDDDSPLDSSFTDNPQIERLIDSHIELGGWIYDRLNGRTRLNKKSMTRKLRKTLGYIG